MKQKQVKKEDFLKVIRRDGEKFRVDQICVNPGGSTIRGKGTLLIQESRFVLEVTLDDAEHVPERPMGVVGASAFWAVSGIIEEQIEFAAKGLPHSSSRHFGPKTFSSLTFSFGHFDLTPQGLDTLTHTEWDALISRRQTATGALPAAIDPPDVTPSGQESDARSSVTAHIVLPEFKLIAPNCGTLTIERNDFLGERQHNAGDTFKGEVRDWTYGLIQVGSDLHVHLRSTPVYSSSGDDNVKETDHDGVADS